MQFDDFDKKIKEAAEHHHPAYDEKAWEMMETLLDKHMPVKKDNRRRFLFLLLLFFVLGSGAFLLVRQNNPTQTPVIKGQNKDVSLASPSTVTKSDKSDASEVADKKAIATDKNIVPKSNGAVTDKLNDAIASKNNRKPDNSAISKGTDKPAGLVTGSDSQPQNTIDRNKETQSPQRSAQNIARSTGKKKNNLAGIKENIVSNNSFTKKNSGTAPAVDESPAPSTVQGSAITPAPGNSAGTTQPSVNTVDSVAQKVADQQDIKPEVSSSPKKNSKKPGKSKQSSFAITFTTGPDLSFVGLNELGRAKMRYGGGLSYTLNRFTLRSGFYVVKKVYSAEGTYYHPNYPNLKEVDGDCKVFEIPVTVNYNFARAKDHNWFASTGLSSYLMKKETYQYLTKDPVSGTTSYYTHSWDNKNKHYFSLLNLSAGYERKFTRSISLIAEPYLQIPLAGVGNGKMKLYSGGMLLTLSVKPFAGKK